jgi:hypothetical protein
LEGKIVSLQQITYEVHLLIYAAIHLRWF